MRLEIDKSYRFNTFNSLTDEESEIIGIYRGVEVNIQMNVMMGGRFPMDTFIVVRKHGSKETIKFPLNDLNGAYEVNID